MEMISVFYMRNINIKAAFLYYEAILGSNFAYKHEKSLISGGFSCFLVVSSSCILTNHSVDSIQQPAGRLTTTLTVRVSDGKIVGHL